MVAFARRDWHGNTVVVICNFAGVPVDGYVIDLPESGVWHEVINSDALEYGGSGVGNRGIVYADENRHASMVLPPLGVLWLRHDPQAHIPSPTHG